MMDIKIEKVEKKTENISVEEFQKEQVLQLKDWGVHKDLRYIQYGFEMFCDDSNFSTWYKIKTEKRKKLFSIKEGDRIRGYISLREITKFNRSAVMGISIDPNYMSMGIGKLALEHFLKKYFIEMDMKTLNLKVALFNKRAIALYESVGFVHKKTKLERFENQMHNFKLLLNYKDFKQFGDFIYTEISSYRMTVEDYKKKNPFVAENDTISGN